MLETLVEEKTKHEYEVMTNNKLEKNINDKLIKSYYKQSKVITIEI
mgnify:CR=1 FL=1|jgi:hypothetical protein